MTEPAIIETDGADILLEGVAIPFGGRDAQGQSFGPETDLMPSWFPNEGRPGLYHHGLDPTIKTDVVGRQVERELHDTGWWVRVQLDRYSQWRKAILELAERGVLFFSSGAVPHLVKVDHGGRIKTWPFVEVSLTTTPASPMTGAYRIQPGKAIEHLSAIKADVPAALHRLADDDATRAELSAIAASLQARQEYEAFLRGPGR